jgi:hypothetical protein
MEWTKFRIWVDGRLVDEGTVMVGYEEAVDDIGLRQAEIASWAEAHDKSYMVEAEFSDGGQLRWGTDPNGMVEPMAMDNLADAIRRRFA